MTLAFFRPRRIVRWKYLLRHYGMMRAENLSRFHQQETQQRVPSFSTTP